MNVKFENVCIRFTEMLHILAASSLHHTVNGLPFSSKKQFLGKITSVPGFSFNRKSKNWFKNARNLLKKGHLSKRKDLVVWHDLINNTISRHMSNNYQPCSVPELTSFLRTNKDRFSAIVYCRRIGTEDIFQELLKSEVLVLSVTKRLMSKPKWKTQPGKYSQLHQEAGLEIGTLDTVRHQYNLRGLLKKGKGKNWGKRQRKAEANIRKVQQTQTDEELLNNRDSLPLSLSFFGVCGCCYQRRGSGMF